MKTDLKRRDLLKGVLAGSAASALGSPAFAGSASDGFAGAMSSDLRGTGDLGIVIERADGSILIIDTTSRKVLGRVEGLGDLSHASAVYSRDARYVYVFGRDGGLTKVDILTGKLVKRIIQGGNSIGGAISQDGRYVAVSNYEPGGVKIFDAETLRLVADIPAVYNEMGDRSKTVGLTDAPGGRFVFSLYDGGEVWVVTMNARGKAEVERFENAGALPYDGLITPDGRYYMAGLFGEDGMAMLDLWQTGKGLTRILSDYGRGNEKMPVYKMPHLEGWASAGDKLFVPGVGHHEVLIIDRSTFQQSGRIAVHGQPVFVMARPDGRHVWVNFALPDNDTVQVIDVLTSKVVHTLKPGKAVLHMEFTPRGEQVWVSVRDENVVRIYDTATFEEIGTLEAKAPSGIFFTARAGMTGL
jgi:protein NirF